MQHGSHLKEALKELCLALGSSDHNYLCLFITISRHPPGSFAEDDPNPCNPSMLAKCDGAYSGPCAPCELLEPPGRAIFTSNHLPSISFMLPTFAGLLSSHELSEKKTWRSLTSLIRLIIPVSNCLAFVTSQKDPKGTLELEGLGLGTIPAASVDA